MQSPKKYEWIKVTEEAAFAPRDGAGALVLDDRMWLLGGWNPNGKKNFPLICNSEIWSSDDGRHWNLEGIAPWEPRHCAGYVLHQGQMWIVGGDSNQGHHQSDVWRSPDGIHWEIVCENAPWSPRVMHYTVAFAGKIWVMGGQTVPKHGPIEEFFYSDVWNSEDGQHWSKVADGLPWGPRGMIGGQVVFDGQIWVIGGGTFETPKRPDRVLHNDVWSSPDGIHWKCHTPSAPWQPRQFHEVAVFDGQIWVLEGYTPRQSRNYCPETGNRTDVWHSQDGVHWTEVPDTPWAARHAASVFVYRNALWLVTGNNLTSDVWKLICVDES